MLKLKRRHVPLVIDPGVIDLTRLELELALILFKIAIWYLTVIILRSPSKPTKRTVTSAFHTMRASFRRLVKRRKQGAKQTTIVDGGIIRFDL